MGTWVKGLGCGVGVLASEFCRTLPGSLLGQWRNGLTTWTPFSSSYGIGCGGTRGSRHCRDGSKTGNEGPGGAATLGRFTSGQLSYGRSTCWEADMKWGGDDKDGGLTGQSRSVFQGYRGWRGLVVGLCRWGGKGLVRGLELDRVSISSIRRAWHRMWQRERNGKIEKVGLNSA